MCTRGRDMTKGWKSEAIASMLWSWYDVCYMGY